MAPVPLCGTDAAFAPRAQGKEEERPNFWAAPRRIKLFDY